MGMNKKRSIVAVFVFLLLELGVVSAGSVTRYMDSSIPAGSHFAITLNVSVGESYYYIVEHVPQGWNIFNSGEAFNVSGNDMTWIGTGNPANTTIVYTLVAPEEGSFSFSGEYAMGSPILFDVMGDNGVMVVPSTSCGDSGENNWYVSGQTDCDQCDYDNDNDGEQPGDWSVYPGAADRCDSDCGVVASTVQLIDYENGAETRCDRIDNDCDGLVDEGLSTRRYRDADKDGYGNPSLFMDICLGDDIPFGYVLVAGDCNDANKNVHPGAVENCTNGLDDDCDGNADGADSDCAVSECTYNWDCNGDTVECGYWTCDAGICMEHADNDYCWALDGTYCDGIDVCSLDDGCVVYPLTLPDCSDGVVCTDDICTEGSSSAICVNSDLCSGGQVCDLDSGGCVDSGTCGNGLVETGEDCEIGNLNGQTCEFQGYPAGGTLACGSCSFDFSGCSPLPSYETLGGLTTNFSSFSDIEHVSDSILEVAGFGFINFSGHTLNYSRLDLDSYVIGDSQVLGVDLSGYGMSNLNVPNVLHFYSTAFNNPLILRNGVVCSSVVCNITNYTLGEFLEASVTGFSFYEVVETPFCGDGSCNGGESCSACSEDCTCTDTSGDSSSGSGSGGATVYECSDGLDNDANGLIDYPNDPGCVALNDNKEITYGQLVGGSCTEAWVCTDWGECSTDGVRTKSCYDENECGTENLKPHIEEYCEMPFVEGVRLDLIFAVVVTILSMVTMAVGLGFWLRRRFGQGGIGEKRKELMEAVRKNVA
jgi:hypothetical protein